MNKVNYHKVFLEQIASLTTKPTLLLHVCCGPCASNVIKELRQYFIITIYYSNSNIYPLQEYQRRLQELLHFIEEFDPTIKVIEHPYDAKYWLQQVDGSSPEGGKRCYQCYELRMKDAYRYASNHRYDYWTTVLSISPHKNSQWINEIGKDLTLNEHTQFLFSDFKKDNGYYKSVQLAKEFGLYRQDYCGCIYSYKEKSNR